jgi:hypothetical protein
VYAWIWRKLPFGLPGKITGSVLLALATAALLWFVVFPWAEPILPFDDVQVESGENVPGDTVPPATVTAPGTDPSNHPGGDFDVPYDPESNNPVPPSGR